MHDDDEHRQKVINLYLNYESQVLCGNCFAVPQAFVLCLREDTPCGLELQNLVSVFEGNCNLKDSLRVGISANERVR